MDTGDEGDAAPGADGSGRAAAGPGADGSGWQAAGHEAGGPNHEAAHLGASESVARQVADLVGERLADGEPIRVLGLTGPPGTGKSTVAGMVADLLEARGVAVAGQAPMDGFHLSNAVLEDLDRADRKGAPDTFDAWGYVALLERVRREWDDQGDGSGRVVYAPGYRRDLHEPVAAMNAIAPRGLVITEGNYLTLSDAGWRDVAGLVDLLVFVDTDRTELLRRLVARQEAFGRDRADAAHWVRTVDAANIDLVMAGSARADVVVRAR